MFIYNIQNLVQPKSVLDFYLLFFISIIYYTFHQCPFTFPLKHINGTQRNLYRSQRKYSSKGAITFHRTCIQAKHSKLYHLPYPWFNIPSNPLDCTVQHILSDLAGALNILF